MTSETDHDEPTFDYPLKELVTFRLVRLNAKFSAQASRILKESAGLTPAQWRVMFMIHDNGPMSPARIGKKIGMDKGQLSRTIKGMLDRGWLQSQPSKADHRSFELSLTAEGSAAFLKAQPKMRVRQSKLMNSLSKGELEALYSVFDKLEAAALELDEAG